MTYHVFKRMRTPLLALLAAYSIAILGMTLIPGVDDQGNPWRMSFFHAFYYVSFMATTIGFGEIPYAFSEAQRVWGIFCIYLTVIAWFYAIGAIINLVQDSGFRGAFIRDNFARSVRAIREPFYIICGYGDTGKELVRALCAREIRAVVVDSNQHQMHDLALTNHSLEVPGVCADVRVPKTLIDAGIQHHWCQGLVAMTDIDAVNLKVAITSKLLNPDMPVICRGEAPEYEENMASFGTDHIIDPFTTFSNRLALALDKPGLHLLNDWLSGVPGAPMEDPVYPPKGTWVVCGFGPFGKAMHASLTRRGIPVVTVEFDPDKTSSPPGTIQGIGADHATLRAAGIENAVGLVAGTQDDANNLSIVMTAVEMNPQLFVVIRQNRSMNTPLFSAVTANLVMQSSRILAREVRLLLTLPLLREFLILAQKRDNDWANGVSSRILGMMRTNVHPSSWSVSVDEERAPAIVDSIKRGNPVAIVDLMRSPANRDEFMPCMPLLLKRASGQTLLTPETELHLNPGDQVLFCGERGVRHRMGWSFANINALGYILTGDDSPDGWVFQKYHAWRAKRAMRQERV
ncbi:putative TrkA domain-containing protein [Magnetofaba australis IT-1]|uniref:Putative TrkA domain-containing protein n=2 Tax=Magnetofaba TaxID=1472292 RepID=A0A1Y2K3H4_9PROT|nr:putative TrkA domain-containing protein [Magnetofaba australis IT-1]